MCAFPSTCKFETRGFGKRIEGDESYKVDKF